ncbi:MAG: acyltransferase [Acetobacteraceae bacterium]|nr:acyltransferase [Acetobacteraceae bacterium]
MRSLTGIRGLAACWVMSGHYFCHPPSNTTVCVFVGHSYVAVDLFLILSGFVLAATYEARFDGKPFAADRVATFLRQRVARIYPLYAVVTLVSGLMAFKGIHLWGDPQVSTGMLLANLLMVQSWGLSSASVVAAGWSVSTEWAANLLFPLFIATLAWRIRHSALVAGIAFLALARIAFIDGNAGAGASAFGALNWYLFPLSLVRCLSEFALGVFCWQLRAQAEWVACLGRTPVLLALLLGAAVLTLATSLDIVLVLLGCCIIIGFSFERSWLAGLCGSAVPRWLGTISFSIYLLHMPFLPLRAALRDVSWSGVPLPDDVANWILMATVIAASALSFHFLERPAQARLRGSSRRRGPRPCDSPSESNLTQTEISPGTTL